MGTLFYLNIGAIQEGRPLLNSHTWARMFIKWDRFLGKFKKGPRHIGEYDKKVHFQGGQSPCNIANSQIT